jgi:hypothetical protein
MKRKPKTVKRGRIRKIIKFHPTLPEKAEIEVHDKH